MVVSNAKESGPGKIQKAPYNGLPLVPESVLKRAHDVDELNRKRAAKLEISGNNSNAKNKRKEKGAVYVIKPETLLSRARCRRNETIRFRRVARKGMQKRASNQKQLATKETSALLDGGENTATGTTTTVTYQSNSVGASLVFCVRIRNNIAVPKQVFHALRRLHLANVHEGVFVRYTDVNRRLLHLVEPWVVYGPVSSKSVEDLIERRGHARINGERVPLSDNTVIEKTLGEHDILCVEDLVHALTNPGDEFDLVTKFLWPFRLADSKTHFERTTLHLKDGKDYGDLGERIEDYIRKVL